MLRSLINDPLSGLISLLYMLPGLILGLTVHEWAHALIDYKLGNQAQKFSGRLSLNPLRHIDWGGLVFFLLLGFGWAKPVASNALYYKRRKLGKVLVSLAGIAANLLVCFLMIPLVFATSGIFWVQNLFFYAAMVNAMLAALNLIPFPPLDGSKVLRELIPSRLDLWMKFDRYGMYVLMLLSITGILGTVVGFMQSLFLSGALSFWELFF